MSICSGDHRNPIMSAKIFHEGIFFFWFLFSVPSCMFPTHYMVRLFSLCSELLGLYDSKCIFKKKEKKSAFRINVHHSGHNNQTKQHSQCDSRRSFILPLKNVTFWLYFMIIVLFFCHVYGWYSNKSVNERSTCYLKGFI